MTNTAPTDRLALASNCRHCGAYADEMCRTPSGSLTRPHRVRLTQAAAAHEAKA